MERTLSDKEYIKSLEGFMIKTAELVGCLPDFNDPKIYNDHIYRAIEKLLTPTNSKEL